MNEKTYIRIANAISDSIVDGPGLRYVIFVQGCPHNCKGCHNPQTHDFNGGKLVSIDSIIDEIKQNPLITGITLSGGEPFCQSKELSELITKIKEICNSNYDILTYTGYDIEYLISNEDDVNHYRDLIMLSDYIIDGKFDINQKSYSVPFRGSTNQRIIDVKKTLIEHKICTTEL
jgi:anaerobic ribonucleoside-triphosphate reductase activating protein